MYYVGRPGGRAWRQVFVSLSSQKFHSATSATPAPTSFDAADYFPLYCDRICQSTIPTPPPEVRRDLTLPDLQILWCQRK